MRPLIGVVIIGVIFYGVWHWRHTSAPSAGQVEPLLKDYLVSGASNGCSGTMTLESFDGVSVGEYSSQLGGWPVFADHVEACHNGGQTSTYDGSHDAERNVAAAFVRRTMTGRLEVYTPAIFENAQREMQQTMQKAIDSIQVK